MNNGGPGVSATCPSLIFGNAALNNAGGNISASGTGCIPANFANNVAP